MDKTCATCIPESGTVFKLNKCKSFHADVFTDSAEEFACNSICSDS